MKKISILCLGAVVSVATVSGCGSARDKGNDPQPDECVEGRRCNPEGNVDLCVVGTWVQIEVCPSECSVIDGVDQCVSAVCNTNGQSRCSAAGDVQTCNQGEWSVSDDCTEGCYTLDAATAECIEDVTCTPSQTECSPAGNLLTCNENAESWSMTDCPTGCVGEPGAAQCALSCPGDDPYEEEIEGQSPPLLHGVGVYEAISCGQDQDWFAINLRAGDNLTVTLTWDSDQSDLDLGLYADTGDIYALVEVKTMDIPEILTHSVATTATYYIQTFNWSDTEQAYTLEVEISQ